MCRTHLQRGRRGGNLARSTWTSLPVAARGPASKADAAPNAVPAPGDARRNGVPGQTGPDPGAGFGIGCREAARYAASGRPAETLPAEGAPAGPMGQSGRSGGLPGAGPRRDWSAPAPSAQSRGGYPGFGLRHYPAGTAPFRWLNPDHRLACPKEPGYCLWGHAVPTGCSRAGTPAGRPGLRLGGTPPIGDGSV